MAVNDCLATPTLLPDMSDDYEDDFEAYESDFEVWFISMLVCTLPVITLMKITALQSEPDADLDPPAMLPVIRADSLYSPAPGQTSGCAAACSRHTSRDATLYSSCSKWWQSDAAIAPGHGPIRCPERLAGESMAQVASHQEEGELDAELVAASAWLPDQLVWNALQVVLSETVQDALFVMEPLSQHELLQMGRGRYR